MIHIIIFCAIGIEYDKQSATEMINVKITTCQMQSFTENGKLPTLAYLAAFLQNDKETTGDIAYIEMQSKKTGSLDETPYTSWDKIYTKLSAYPYEFEINNSLQLESIDGIKVASNSNEEIVSKSDYDQLAQLVATLSQKVTNLESKQTSASNPTGTIIAYSVNTVPEGYLKCEGQEVSRATYKVLFDIIGTTYGDGNGSTTFKLPDLRGEFLRGTGTNSHTNQGNGADVGKHQDGTGHQYTDNYHWGFGFHKTAQSQNKDSQYNLFSTKYIVNTSRNDTHQVNGYYTSRPTNTSVLYCIKY